MAHIDDQRLMELAFGAERTLEDTAHLAACAQCRDALAAEAEFSATLTAVPKPAPPAFLARQIEAAFVARASRAPVVALAVTALVLLPLTILLLGRWTELVCDLGSFAVVTRVLTGLVFAHGSAPVLVAAQSVMLLGGLAVLMRLLRQTALAPEVMR